MSDNHFFAEQELCNGMMNDRVVDKRRKLNEPKHWRARQAVAQERVVVARGGVVSRVLYKMECDPSEPQLAGGAELLAKLSAEVRRARSAHPRPVLC